jgi:hypothetical protein
VLSGTALVRLSALSRGMVDVKPFGGRAGKQCVHSNSRKMKILEVFLPETCFFETCFHETCFMMDFYLFPPLVLGRSIRKRLSPSLG